MKKATKLTTGVLFIKFDKLKRKKSNKFDLKTNHFDKKMEHLICSNMIILGLIIIFVYLC